MPVMNFDTPGPTKSAGVENAYTSPNATVKIHYRTLGKSPSPFVGSAMKPER